MSRGPHAAAAPSDLSRFLNYFRMRPVGREPQNRIEYNRPDYGDQTSVGLCQIQRVWAKRTLSPKHLATWRWLFMCKG